MKAGILVLAVNTVENGERRVKIRVALGGGTLNLPPRY